MPSFIKVVISQNELQLLGSVEKWITLASKTETFPRRAKVDKAMGVYNESKLNILEDLTSKKSYPSVIAFLRD